MGGGAPPKNVITTSDHDTLTAKETELGAGEMGSGVKSIAAFPEDWGRIPSTAKAAHNCL